MLYKLSSGRIVARKPVCILNDHNEAYVTDSLATQSNPLQLNALRLLKADASCWVLTDGKAGDEVQCLGVARAIHDANPAFTITQRRVSPRAPFVWAMPWGRIDPREAPHRKHSPIKPPFPDILIASGRRAVPYMRAVKRASGGRTLTVFLKDPRLGAGTADFIWVAEHDRLRSDNVLTTLTAPHCLSQTRLADARVHPPLELASLSAPRVAVLVGGNSRHHTFRDEDIARFLQYLEALTVEGASLMVTTSRRTPEALRRGLANLIQCTGGYLWDSITDDPATNPYVAMLALADWVVVTADSTNMLGEAAASGAPLLFFEPSGGHAKFRKLLHGLEMLKAAQPLRGRLEGNKYRPLDATVTVAQGVVQIFNTHWATFNK